MVTKIIACADIHFPLIKGFENLEKVLSNFITKCEKIVEEEGRDNVRIVIGGDTFHNKTNISPENITHVYDFFKRLNCICNTIVIAGNHDYLVNNTDRIDSLTPIFEIGNLENVTYLDRELGFKSGIFIDDNIAWCLFSSFEGFNTPSIVESKERHKDEGLTYVGLIHGDVNGAISSTNYVVEHGLDGGMFSDCDFVIAGHIHKRQEIKKDGVKIVYCSSLRQNNFGESISGHGFVLWDVQNKDYEYIDVENPDGGYFKFEVYGLEDIENDFEELINL